MALSFIKNIIHINSCMRHNEVMRLEALVYQLLQSGSIQTAMTLAQWLFLK